MASLTPKEIANRITEYLFQNGAGDKGNRLILELENGRDGGGWGKYVVRDVIEREITAALNGNHNSEPTPRLDSSVGADNLILWLSRSNAWLAIPELEREVANGGAGGMAMLEAVAAARTRLGDNYLHTGNHKKKPRAIAQPGDKGRVARTLKELDRILRGHTAREWAVSTAELDGALHRSLGFVASTSTQISKLRQWYESEGIGTIKRADSRENGVRVCWYWLEKASV